MRQAELLAADLTCARDHVAFVEKEVRRLRLPVSPASAPEAVVVRSTGKPIAGAVVPVPTPFDRLRRFIDRNGEHGFIDLRSPGVSRIRFQFLKRRALQSEAGRVLGYAADGEYWIPNAVFEEVVGGEGAGDASRRRPVE